MNNLQVYGEMLSASADDRTLAYRLLPFGEASGRTKSGHVFTASKDSLVIPKDISHLVVNAEHNQFAPIGRFGSIEMQEDGLYASVQISDFDLGDAALMAARSGAMTGISVEVRDAVIRAGRLIAGELTGAALCETPSIENAVLMAAADCGELPKDSSMETNSTLEAAESPAVDTFFQAAPLLASDSTNDFAQTLFAAANSSAGLTAALAEVHTDFDPAKVYLKDQDLGTLWTARRTGRPIAERFLKGSVDGLTLTGTRRTRETQVADWAGNRVELPTSPGFTTSREFWSPQAKVVALGLSAEIVAFGDASVIADIYSDALDSYYEQTETIVINKLINDSTGVSAATGAIAAVAKAADVMNAIGANLDFVLVSPDVHAAIRDIKASDAPWWLQNQGKVSLSDGTIQFDGGPLLVSSAELAPKTVIAGDARALDFRESADFKHRAHNLPVFGEDISLVKFYALKTLDAGALIKFTNVTGA